MSDSSKYCVQQLYGFEANAVTQDSKREGVRATHTQTLKEQLLQHCHEQTVKLKASSANCVLSRALPTKNRESTGKKSPPAAAAPSVLTTLPKPPKVRKVGLYPAGPARLLAKHSAGDAAIAHLKENSHRNQIATFKVRLYSGWKGWLLLLLMLAVSVFVLIWWWSLRHSSDISSQLFGVLLRWLRRSRTKGSDYDSTLMRPLIFWGTDEAKKIKALSRRYTNSLPGAATAFGRVNQSNKRFSSLLHETAGRGTQNDTLLPFARTLRLTYSPSIARGDVGEMLEQAGDTSLIATTYPYQSSFASARLFPIPSITNTFAPATTNGGAPAAAAASVRKLIVGADDVIAHVVLASPTNAVDVAWQLLDHLNIVEVEELLLAEGGWTRIPNQRNNSPIQLPHELPLLPHAGGGLYLRRHHESPDIAPASEWLKMALNVEQHLKHNRQLLTSKAYRQAASAMRQAVRENQLTRAVRLHGQFLYPWKMFTDAEREALRLQADQVRWFPKWVKNHRHSQRVDAAVLDMYLPVVAPRFLDFYGGPGSPSLGLSRGIRFTWLGHATGVVNVDGLHVLIDPMFEDDLISLYNEWLHSVVVYFNKWCGSLGGRLRQPACDRDGLPANLDVVILSHNHPDHIMEKDIETLCRRLADKHKRLIWYVPEGVSSFLRQHGCNSSNIYEFSWAETRTLSCHIRRGKRVCVDGVWKKDKANVEAFEITFTAGLHWAGRSASKADHNHSLWGGFAIRGPRHRFFYGGDTAYWRQDFNEYRKIGKLLGPFHLAALPIGAYEPNEDLRYQHVNPHEAVRMFKDLRAEVAVGVHWGTLRLSAEEFFDPMLDLECALVQLTSADCRKTQAIRNRYTAVGAHFSQFTSQTSTSTIHPINRGSSRVGAGVAAAGRGEQETVVPHETDLRFGETTAVNADGYNLNLLVDFHRKEVDDKHQVGAKIAARESTSIKSKKRHQEGEQAHLLSEVDSKQAKVSVAEQKKAGDAEDAKVAAEFRKVLVEIEDLMLPLSDKILHASNFQRLVRSLKLQEANLLPNSRTWKDNLLKEGARFQTLFLGQSIQVESTEADDYIWMTRSSGLEHVLPEAPEEHYTFTPAHFRDTPVDPLITHNVFHPIPEIQATTQRPREARNDKIADLLT